MPTSYDEVSAEEIAAIQMHADLGWGQEVYKRYRDALTPVARDALFPHDWDGLPVHYRELLAFTYAAGRDDWEAVETL